MNEPIEGRWLPGAARGEPDAVEALVRHLLPAVYRYTRARLPDRSTAEDVTQEVGLALVRALRRRQVTTENVRAYVFGIATNRVAMYYRTAGRRRELLTDDVPDHEARTPGPEQVATSRETQEQMATILAGLTPAQRDVVLLRIAAGLTAEETGRALGLTANTVRVTQFRALARLRQVADPEVLR